MFCINCFHEDTKVSNSRPHKKQPVIWRRRRCSSCDTIFTTYERPSLAENKKITLPNGEVNTFNIGKLIISIAKSFTHNAYDAQYNTLWLALSVEDTLSTQQGSITPENIAGVTHSVLKQYDHLAAVQYAAQHQLITSVRQRRGRPSLVWHEPLKRESPSR